MTVYSLQVIQNYWKKIQDGTLWTLNRLRKSGQSRTHLYKAEDSRFLHIVPKITRTKSLDDYMRLVRDEAGWETFEHERLDPCFLYEVNFHPFETPVFESEAHAADPLDNPETVHSAATHNGHTNANDNALAENSSVSPAQIIELSLDKIDHRFPGGDGEPASETAAGEAPALKDWGDKDIRDLIATQTYIFQNNYGILNRRRRVNVRLWMRIALGVVALWAWWTLETLAGSGVRPMHGILGAALVYADIDLSSARILVRALCSPWTFMVVTLGLYAGVFAWAQHLHNLERLRFVGSVRSSSATVSKSVTSRLDNLLYVARALIEEIDRGKDDAWDQGTLKPWASETQKLAKLVFWCDQRIYGIEDFLRMHMKLIGLCNDGIRDEAKFMALMLIYRQTTLACLVPLTWWAIGTHVLMWHGPVFGLDALPALICCAVSVAGFAYLLLRLHGLIKAQEPPESIYNLISWAATKTMKGYRNSQLYKEMAAFITREKRRLLREEEKRRA